MKHLLFALTLGIVLSACQGYDVSVGVGTIVNGTPVNANVRIDRSKDAKNVQPVQP